MFTKVEGNFTVAASKFYKENGLIDILKQNYPEKDLMTRGGSWDIYAKRPLPIRFDKAGCANFIKQAKGGLMSRPLPSTEKNLELFTKYLYLVMLSLLLIRVGLLVCRKCADDRTSHN